LPEEERLILTMHYVYQVSAAEIAGKLGVPERAVLTVISTGSIPLNFISFLSIPNSISDLTRDRG
jgi:hypothetical protein